MAGRGQEGDKNLDFGISLIRVSRPNKSKRSEMKDVWCTICGRNLVSVTTEFAKKLHNRPGIYTAACDLCTGRSLPRE